MIMQKYIIFALLISLISSALIYCPPGQFFDGQHCQKCQSNCVCTTMGGCDSCITGYTFSLDKTTCIACPTAAGNYAACTECCANPSGILTSCTDCDTTSNLGSTFLMSGRCLVKQGCFEIDSKGFCKYCRNGYFFKDNACTACDASCSTCLGADNCQTCASGYYNKNQNGALCTACPTGCASCTSSGSCSSCLDGYYLYITQCLACPTNCKTCVDGSTCSSCTSGILVSNLCILCTDLTYGGSVGCTSCTSANSFINCSTCGDTYYLDSNSNCQTCSSAIPNAARCLDSKTPTQCLSDNDAVLTNRYYLLSISCVLNVNSCRKVKSIIGECVSCYDGYYLSPTFACVQCAFTGCVLTSASVVSNVCTCTSCLSGYRLNGVNCEACTVGNCDLCPTVATTCTQCKAGYYLSGGVCAVATAPNCQVATAAATCTSCIAGYYLGSDGACYLCESSCLQCSGKYVCTKCQNGYTLQNGNCLAAISNCYQMDSTFTSCSICNHGYTNYKGLCKQCSVQSGTLDLCSGLCPLDYYIENILIQNWQPSIAAPLMACILILTM